MADDKVFDIDEKSQGFAPLTVKFRGEQYVLGDDALGVLTACEMHSSVIDSDADDAANMAKLMEMLPSVIAMLCPGFPVDDWSTGEKLTIMQAATEVLQRVGALTFQAGAGE